MFAETRDPFSVFDISIAKYASLGCILGSVLPKVITLKKYQNAS
jgi:hypothetical protein